MTFLKLPLTLAAATMLRRVDAACVEDYCYGAVFFNPAGPEECSSHYITTVIPSPSTTTVTVASAVADITTITGAFVGASTVIPWDSIPTYIVRACYGDVSYRFESACSCIGAGPTTTTAAVPVVTETVLLPFSSSSESSTLPSPAPSSSSFTRFANQTSFISSTGSFSTVLRTSSFSGFFSTSSTVVTSEPSTSEPSTSEEEPTSMPAPTSTSLETSQTSAASITESLTTAEPLSTIIEESSSQTSVASTTESSTTTAEPSSTTTESSSSQGPSSTTTSSAPSGPTSFVPMGPVIILEIAAGALAGQFIQTDEPDEIISTNLRSHVTPDIAVAAVWTLDTATGILFQEINGAWWGAFFGLGLRKLWDTIKLLPADTVVGWLANPVPQKAPLTCVIDFTASDVISCGSQQWTKLMQSDTCGWAITTPYNPSYAAACPASVELVLQAVEVTPYQEGGYRSE